MGGTSKIFYEPPQLMAADSPKEKSNLSKFASSSNLFPKKILKVHASSHQGRFFPYTSQNIADSVLSYLLTGEEVKVTDLALHHPPKAPSPAVSAQSQRFNQIPQFFINQILDERGSLDTARRIVKKLCKAENILLKSGAFEPARSLSVVFDQASISRLEKAFSASFSHFENLSSWYTPKKDFEKLRALQNEHPTPFESMSIIHYDLSHIREIPIFKDDGEVHLNRLKILGDIFNKFVSRKISCYHYWNKIQLNPSPPLLKEFFIQTGQFEDQEELWWKRSQEIHPHKSSLFWGKKI